MGQTRINFNDNWLTLFRIHPPGDLLIKLMAVIVKPDGLQVHWDDRPQCNVGS